MFEKESIYCQLEGPFTPVVGRECGRWVREQEKVPVGA